MANRQILDQVREQLKSALKVNLMCGTKELKEASEEWMQIIEEAPAPAPATNQNAA